MTTTALILIDVQQGFDHPKWGKRNNPAAELHIASLLQHWREQDQTVIHVQHQSVEPDSPLRADQPGCEFKALARPLSDEVVFAKQVNSAFIGTGLEAYLQSKGISQLVIAGLTTDHCVSTTTRMAGNLGFNVSLAADACATFDRPGTDGINISADDIHRIHLSSLHNEFCQVKTTSEIIALHS
ncbi:cysteine hydrolase family protein [Undibacterium sp. TJN19]|uniref:cysteine hydrolase family protein n=1 Tax=Undibacterium sp. TJN19 TaxID=3413055 RepID=UPI003BF33C8C